MSPAMEGATWTFSGSVMGVASTRESLAMENVTPSSARRKTNVYERTNHADISVLTLICPYGDPGDGVRS